MIHCKECAWFAPIESIPETEKIHNKLHDLFDGVLPAREGKCGIFRKVTFCTATPWASLLPTCKKPVARPWTALQTVYDAPNPGQQKQIVKDDAVKVLFDSYDVDL